MATAPAAERRGEVMSSRATILTRLRDATVARQDAYKAAPASPQAAFDSLDREALVRQFSALAQEGSSSVARLKATADVPSAVSEYLRSQGLPDRLVVAPNTAAFDWSALDVSAGPVAADGDAVCTGCYAGIAEAGALVVTSGADHPTEFNFLAATHIAVLSAKSIVPTFEHLWAKLDTDALTMAMPRMMNFIVGPSRTADLGVPSKLGAHGPARLHILIIEQEGEMSARPVPKKHP